MLKLIRDTNQAVVACRTPSWECLIVELPSCVPLVSISMVLLNQDLECQQIRCC